MLVFVNRDICVVRAGSDIDGCEDETESDQNLMLSKWNKDVEQAWRMDKDITVGDLVEEIIGNESNGSNSNTDYGDSGCTLVDSHLSTIANSD